jgi:hypothetical protein
MRKQCKILTEIVLGTLNMQDAVQHNLMNLRAAGNLK